MGILEKEVWVGLANKNIQHFDRLDYELPYFLDKKGMRRLPRKTQLFVRVKDLMEGSTVKVTKICDICGSQIKNQPYNAILYSRKITDGKDRCNDCGNKYANKSQIDNVEYEKSFKHHATINNLIYLFEEFSDRNKKKPIEISHGSQIKYWWTCPIFGKEQEYEMKIGNRIIKKQGCPYCSGQKINKTNCLWTTHPDVAKLLKHPEIGYKITSGRNKKESFVCFYCKYDVGRKAVHSVVKNGLSCQRCSDGISYPEKFMTNILYQLKLSFEYHKVFEWSEGKNSNKRNGSKIYDFFIPELSCIIEVHGRQHYDLGFEHISKSTLEKEIENDALKKKLATKNSIQHYIVIDCSKSELEYIKKNIINSDLSSMYDLLNIDWLLCHEYACRSLVKDVCDLWMDGYKDMRIISDKLKLGLSTVAKYIRQGVLLGWCDYNPEDGIKKSGRYPDRPVVKLSLEGTYIEDYISISSASKLLGIATSIISLVCKSGNNSESAGSFRWMYKEDYELYKNEIKPYVRKFNNKPIVRLTLEGNFIDEFDGATNACEKLGIQGGHISSVCTGKRKIAYGFKWMFKEDYDKLRNENITLGGIS